jgi:hypothetical protein
MRGFTNRVSGSLFALVTAAALAFGGTTAFAQVDKRAASVAACPDDGWSTDAGYCGSPENCDLKCKGRYYAAGACMYSPDGYCCVCVG